MTDAPILRTERLILRPARLGDFKGFADLYASPRSKYIGGPRSPKAAWKDFAHDVGQWSLLGFGSWAIERRKSGDCIGQIGLNFPPHYPERELGWLLWEGFEGNGYAYEAALCARKFAYGTLGWTTAVSYISRENVRSIRLAERMGAVIDRNASLPDNDPDDLVYRHPPP